ncbi:MAG TPA: BadF/BadG/BcrA/BcrD ATPase family protein [Candidatus Baltobacteraceae bacterium]|nr:BadF/BadG/BcrA/BcrD ATPase family protein [Candidatus Baltobacteraceae bacterium]
MPDVLTAVGVDAGGSHTVAVVGSDGERLRTFTGTAGNPQLTGIEAAADAIAVAVRGVLQGERASAIAVGAAGAGRADVAGALESALRARFPGARIAVRDDAHMALRGAVASGDGIALIAGTGSIAYAEIDGRPYRAGGHGYAVGDDGSGYAIGAAALKLLLRAYEGRAPRDELVRALEERIGATGIGDVLTFVYAGDGAVATVASVAPVVLACAAGGERSANKIVQTAALELFELVRTICRTSGTLTRELPIAFCGGLLRENSVLTYVLETRLSSELPDLAIVRDGNPAYVAALAQARAMLDDR